MDQALSVGKFTGDQVVKRYNDMKGSRGVQETHWQDVLDYFIPDRQDILTSKAPGQKRRNHIFDSSGEHSMELLNAALFSMLTPRQLNWVDFTSGDEEIDSLDEVRDFHQKLSRKFLDVLNGSNFYCSIQEMFQDLTSVGTGIMAIEDDEEQTIRCTTHIIAETVIDEDNKGRVNEIYRRFEWSAKNIVAEFGMENTPKKVKDSFEKGDNKKFYIIHGVYPSVLGQGPEIPGKKKYVDHYVLEETKEDIKIEGRRKFPFVTPRWKKMSGEIYGRSPAMSALPEVKVVNQMEKTVLKGAQKTIDPPLEIEDDGVLTRPNTTPGGLNFKRPGSAPIRPILNDARIDFGFQVGDRTRQRIRENFFTDQLQLQQGPQMTATEVERRVERQLQLLGPMLTRLEDEFLRPFVDIVVDIMILRGIISEEDVPEALKGAQVKPMFSSTIARAQKASELSTIERTIQVAAPFIQADPSVLDNVNGDAAIRIAAKIQGLDQRMLRTEDEVMQIREDRAKAQQAAAEAEARNQNVDNASKAGQTMAKMQAVQQAAG